MTLFALGCGDEGTVAPGESSAGVGGGLGAAAGMSGVPGGAGKPQGSGGATATGGAANGGSSGTGAGTGSSGSGGTGGAGGAAGASGGSSSGSAGTQAHAGAPGSGGAPSSGGASTNGGASTTGGAANSGGGGRGGAAAAGGSPGGGGATAGSGGATAGSGGSIDVKNVTAACPGAVPAGVTATWCSCEQWGEKTVGAYTYYNDIWGSGPGPQCIWLADSGAWGVASSHPSGGGIKAYPNVSVSPKQVISSINSYTTSFDMLVPSAGTYDSAYDLWVKGTTAARIEIMLWMSYRGGAQPIAKSYDASGAVADEKNVTVGGHTWNVYYGSNGSNDVASFVRTSNTTSGTIDIKAILSWLIANNHSSYGVFTASYTLDQVQFGHEITTDSGTQAYVLRSFSVTSN